MEIWSFSHSMYLLCKNCVRLYVFQNKTIIKVFQTQLGLVPAFSVKSNAFHIYEFECNIRKSDEQRILGITTNGLYFCGLK